MNISVKTVEKNSKFAAASRSKRKGPNAPDVEPMIHTECFLYSVAGHQPANTRRRHQDLVLAEVNRSEAVCLTNDRTGSN